MAIPGSQREETTDEHSPVQSRDHHGAGKRRVGNWIARRLAQRGYDIAIHYKHSSREAEETVEELVGLGVKAVAVQADLVHEEPVHRLVDQTLGVFGRIDLLVTVATLWEKMRLEDITGVCLPLDGGRTIAP
jgi:pteridine reductase